jgi:hypothetical protein
MKLLMLFNSIQGHVYRLTQAVAKGADQIPDVEKISA